MDAGEPSYTGNDTGNRILYGLGSYLFLLLLVFALCYASYICKRSPPTTSFDSAIDDHYYITLPHGLDDDILATFPTILYSEAISLFKGTDTDDNYYYYGSGCSICLADYRPEDVLRLLPECGHFFHAGCIDTWLKVHPTCPVCRKSLDLT